MTQISYKYTNKLLFLTLLLFSMAFAVFSNFDTVSADQSVIYVNGSSGNDSWDGQSATWISGTTNGPKLSIKNATGTVNTNGTIYIANGQYTGVNNTGITISRNMTIAGQSQNRTIINGTGTNWIFSVISGVNLTVQNLTVANGTTIYGGAIYNGGICNVIGCTFTGNTALAYGGAIFNVGTISLRNCNFTNNKATNSGGTIYNQATTTLSGCNFTNNEAINGGAIFNAATITSLNGCNFINNTALVYGGGAIDNAATITSLSGCNFINNTASAYYGGAIANNFAIIGLGGCNFINNKAKYGGGAIYVTTTSSLSGCNFTNNIATNGGAIYIAAVTTSLSGCNFINNTASTYGGAICNFGNLTVKGNNFKGNTATVGGALYSNGGTATLNFNRIVGNNPNWSEIYSTSGIVNATLNWWGSNDNPSVYVNSNVNVTSWMVLHVTAIPNTILNSSNSTVTVNICFDNLNNYYDPANGHVPDGTPVTFTGTLGSFNQPSTKLVNGVATSVFTANHAGTASINAIVDDQTVSALVTVDALPVVNSINPANNTKINITSKIITVTFSEPIQEGIAYNTITVTGPSGAISMIPSVSGSVLTLTPVSNYADGIYTVNIPVNGVIDLAGNGLTNAFTSSFTVDTILPTASANIASGLYNSNKNITLSMNEPGTIYYATDGSTPTLTSRQYTGPITVTSTTTLKFMAVDKAGNKSPVYTRTYTIDKIPPKMISTSPKNGATGISRTGTITIKFSENIKSSINWSKIVVKDKYDHAVLISKSISGNTLNIKTNSKRLSYSYYTVYIPVSAVKDYAGNNLAAGYTFRFKTRGNI
ncbi:Ig-like domain-containing protein [Methanobacterium sp.]|uniref:Ig-like domain-containing protein n=1 Tax=Methanobacterium sp. TaxID=2164 RepID=UPI003C75945E